MSDGLSDARRETEIVDKVERGLSLLEKALDDGGYDAIFGINDAIVRMMNASLRKYGLVVKRKR